jgi:type II pantothenate kinase
MRCGAPVAMLILTSCRAIHTNLYARFKCESLLLAMIKTERLAKRLFGNSGALYDCVCKVR